MLDRYYLLYVTVFLLSLSVTALTEKRLIPYLSGRANQPIYEEGPSWHLAKKGTPTMGGLAFVLAIGTSLLLSTFFLFRVDKNAEAISLLLCVLYALLNSLIGVFDDLKKLKRKKNLGLTPKQKLLFQTLFAAFFLTARTVFLTRP